MDDLIGRSVLKAALSVYKAHDLVLIGQVLRLIDILPAAERKGEWIAASESLPEIGKKVLCLCQADIYEVLALASEGWYHDERHCYMRGFVVAWMPLPEPYEVEEGDKNGDM